MERVAAGTVEIDRCYKCGGIWLDRGEYEALARLARTRKGSIGQLDIGSSQGESGQRYAMDDVFCPRDGSAMRIVRDAKQQHIEYELCSKCGGMFLDAGELTDMTEFTLGERIQAVLDRLGRG